VARFGTVVADAAVLLTFLGAGVVGVVVVFAGDIVVLLYGDAYASASMAAAWVLGAEALHFLSVLCIQILIAIRSNRFYPLVSLAGLGINVGLNLVLIPRWSFEGAAVATMLTEVIVLALLSWLVVRLPGARAPLGAFARIAGALALEIGAGLVLGSVLPWPVAALSALAVYLAAIHVVGLRGRGGLRVVPDLIRADS
jgi:O-antigen/teichoic acid export membrane protein